MVVGFTTTYVISACHHQPCEFESRAWRGVLDATLCDKSLSVICGFSPGCSTNKTNRHGIAEILLKVALNTPTHNNKITVFNNAKEMIFYCTNLRNLESIWCWMFINFCSRTFDLSRILRCRWNRSSYYQKLSPISVERKTHIETEWQIKLLLTCQICEISDFVPLLEIKLFFFSYPINNAQRRSFWRKKCIKVGWRIKISDFEYPPLFIPFI